VIRSSVNPIGGEGFDRFTEQLEERIVEGLDAAAVEAAAVAQAKSTIDLQVEPIKARGVSDGYSSGIKAHKQSRWSTTPIAEFFDAGTLGKRKRKLKGRRKESWQVHARGGTHTAHRGDITPEKGIPRQNFFVKARLAGRRRLLEVIHRA
jgi:hypothetical protein